MNTHRTVYTSMAIAVLLSGLGATAWADKEKERGRGRGEEVRGSDRVIQVDRAAPGIDRRSNDRVIQLDRTVTGVDRRPSNPVVHVNSPYRGRDPRGIVIEGGRRTIPPQVHTQYQQRGWVIDKRYNHNHYYPPRGHVVSVLPARYHTVHYQNVPYYFFAGVVSLLQFALHRRHAADRGLDQGPAGDLHHHLGWRFTVLLCRRRVLHVAPRRAHLRSRQSAY